MANRGLSSPLASLVANGGVRKFTPVLVFFTIAFFGWLFGRMLPGLYPIAPGPGIALGILYFEGLAWWPVVYLGFLTGNLLSGVPLVNLVIGPLAKLAIAAGGAFILRELRVDPLFRNLRDTFIVIAVLGGVALISPIASVAASSLAELLGASARTIAPGPAYVASVFGLIMATPFTLRWLAKPRFKRRFPELIETVAIFAILVIIDIFLFFTSVGSVAGISLTYFLLPPLLWIALRLRPRFVTLALLITSVIAFTGAFVRFPIGSDAFETYLFQVEVSTVILAIVFLVLSALEEERRVTATLARSQVATLQNALARINSESRAKNDFIAILAHELRNPLAPIASSIELLQAKKLDRREEQKTLTLMENRMDTVKRLLNDLLDVSRITERKVSLEKEVCDAAELIRRAIGATAHYYKERHQLLSAALPPHPVLIEVDPVRIEQVFSNLLTNASKYSHTGGEVRLFLYEEEDRVRVVVADRGVGIDASLLEHIFEPFRQGESGTRSKAGLGIGLALVKSFVEMHEGTVAVESEGAGRGSRFTILLPRASASAKVEPKKKQRSAPVPTSGRRILVVDDNDAAAWGVGKLLELEGYAVTYAYDGKQALARASEAHFDVIILDIGLPGEDGHSVAKTLREQSYRGHLIALSGYSLEEDKERGAASGFDEYLVKPVGLADLQRVLRKKERPDAD